MSPTRVRQSRRKGASIGDAVSVAAPSRLRDLVTACIGGHVGGDMLGLTLRVEHEERRLLNYFAGIQAGLAAGHDPSHGFPDPY